MPVTSHPADGDRHPDEPPAGDVVVLGDGTAAVAISRRLEREGHIVSRLDGVSGDSSGSPALDRLADAATVVVATASDGRNLLVAQLLRTRFGRDRVIVLANDPDRVPAFVDAGHEPICAATAVSDAIAAHL